MRVIGDPGPANNGLFYIHSDHLGSTSVLTKYSDGYIRTDSLTRHAPFGAYRTGGPNQITDRGFTGQKENMSGLGLYYYQARFYVPGIGRFLSADTIVPDPTSPQSLNRYAYTLNSPLNYSDPTGHRQSDGCEYEGCTLPDFMNPDETWIDDSGQHYPYNHVLAKQNSPNINNALTGVAFLTELGLDTFDQYLKLSGGRGVPGFFGTGLVAYQAYDQNRLETPNRIIYEITAYLIVDAAVDTGAGLISAGTAAGFTFATGNPVVGVGFGTATFVGVQIGFNELYGDSVDQSIDGIYDTVKNLSEIYISPNPMDTAGFAAHTLFKRLFGEE